jgi:hypothetical protein
MQRTNIFSKIGKTLAVATVILCSVIILPHFVSAQSYTELRITDEGVTRIDATSARVDWKTNIPATSRVVFDKVPHLVLAYDEAIGYASSTAHAGELVTEHSVTVSGLTDLTTNAYYFRPYSQQRVDTVIKTVGSELTVPAGAFEGAPATTTPMVPMPERGETSTSSPSSPTCGVWIHDFLRYGSENNPAEVRNLQLFLNVFESAGLSVNGVYDLETKSAIENYQRRYTDEILAPWGITEPTGYVYLTTRKKVNEQYCGSLRTFPLTPAEEEIIASSRQQVDTPPVDSPEIPTGEMGGEVPEPGGGETGGLTDGIDLDGDNATTGSSTSTDGLPDDVSGEQGRSSTVTPGTFFSGLLAGVPDVEVPFVLAIIAALLLCLGGFILLRSFRARPDGDEAIVFGTASSPQSSIRETEVTTTKSTITEKSSTDVPPSENIINLPASNIPSSSSDSGKPNAPRDERPGDTR